MALLVSSHPQSQRGVVEAGEEHVSDLLHGEHPWLLESFGLQVVQIADPGCFARRTAVFVIVVLSFLHGPLHFRVKVEVTFSQQALLRFLLTLSLLFRLSLYNISYLCLQRVAPVAQIINALLQPFLNLVKSLCILRHQAMSFFLQRLNGLTVVQGLQIGNQRLEVELDLELEAGDHGWYVVELF